MENDDEETDDQYMKNLYDRFRKQVMDGGAIDYFEKDELLDIYDYAQDEGDVMVQFYVLQTAARLFPDDRSLEERAGFFVSYISSDAGSDMLHRKGREPSSLWDVLDLGIKNYPDGDPEEGIKALIARYDRFDIETIIKLIDLLRDMNRVDLLVKYLKPLRDKAEDLKAFLYEVADVFKGEEGHVDLARQAAEELTVADPFNIDSWLLLGKIEFGNEHLPEAINAADYALAIDPDNDEAQLLKAVAQVPNDQTRLEATAFLERRLKKEPENAIAVRALGEAYTLANQKAKAIKLYLDFFTRDTTNHAPLMDILRLKPSAKVTRQALDLFAKDVADDETRWLALGRDLCQEDLPDQAIAIFDYYREVYGNGALTISTDLYAFMLYDKQDFEKLIDFFVRKAEISNEKNAKAVPTNDIGIDELSQEAKEALENEDEAPVLTPTLLLMLAAALLRAHHYRDAADIAGRMLQWRCDVNDLDAVLRFKGLQLTARVIHSIATDPKARPFPSNIDPLLFDLTPPSPSGKKKGS